MEPTGKTSEEGRIPELAEDGQNWKIYHAKFLKVAATKHLLSIIAGWESDDGSKDWVLSHTKYVWYRGHRDHISCVPKTEELFQEHFYWLKAPGVEEEKDCRCHPMRRLLRI